MRPLLRPLSLLIALLVSLLVAPSPASATPQREPLTAALSNLIDDDFRELVADVIDPDDYVCASTPLFDWLDASIAGWTAEDRADAAMVLLFDPVLYDALLFPDPARSFGRNGEYTGTLQRSFRNLKRFWDIPAADIEMVPAHGSTLLDRARVARVLRVVFAMSDAEALEVADAIARIVDQPQFDHGDHPIFTFNAFAFSAEGLDIPGVGVPSDKIIMGDGILAGFRAIGLGDVAPNAVLGHEFGHHIQYERDLFDSPLTGPEATRRTELMADSFSAYHATHVRGDNVRWTRARQFLKIFYNLGDCQFDYPGHHGTPNQRLRAADWGHDVAGHGRRILPSATFARLFERRLPSFVAPDAGL